jgi:thiol-disulfide isomerase/thioredoxin
MKTLHRILLVAIACAFAAVPAAAEDEVAAPPRPAAEFSLDDYAGKGVVVDFWASWCGPCRHALPWLNTMQSNYGSDGLQVVMINLDKKEGAAAKMEAEIDAAIIQYRDPEGELAEKFEVQGMPSTYVYDREGELVTSHVGFLKGDAGERENELRDLVAKGGN